MANATVTVKSSEGDYTSLNAALAGEAADLTANCHSTGGAGILTIECWNFEDTTTATTGSGYTTSADYYINIIGRAADKTSSNTGKWSTDRYRLNGTGNPMLSTMESYTRVTDLQVKTSGNVGVRIVETGQLYDSVILGGCGRVGFSLETSGTVRNCISMNTGRQGFTTSNTGVTLTVQNCTAINAGYDGFAAISGSTLVATNCLAYSCGNGSTYFDFAGAGTMTLNYCASSDATADDFGGTGNRASQTFTFVNDTGTYTGDYHLASNDAGARDYGTSLAGTFTTDIDGQTRTGTWDIGADEYVAAGGASIPRSNPFSRPFSQSLGRGGL